MAKKQIEWWPQPRQMTFLTACGLDHPFVEGGSPGTPAAKFILYGGAAGGGKSDCLLASGIIACLTWAGISVGYFRREYPMLEGPGGAIMRSHELLTGIAKWNGQMRRWTFPNGSILQFCHSKLEEDVYNYKSQQFDIILLDEATEFTRFQVRYLLTRNRATKEGITPFVAAATNPGGVGHNWAFNEFVNAGEPEFPQNVEVEKGKYEMHIFIPAKLSDNYILERRDPGYRKNLENQAEHIKRMLLDGDWTAFQGQAFDEYRYDIHVCKPFPIPPWWRRWLANDPGYSDPFVWFWMAAAPDGKVYVYREYTREADDPKVTYSAQAGTVNELSIIHKDDIPPDYEFNEELGEDPSDDFIFEHLDFAVLGKDAWNKHPETGKSILNYYDDGGLPCGCIPATTDRRDRKAVIHEYLAPYDDENVGEKTAKLQIFNTCRKLIETLPMLTIDPNDAKKVKENSEIDHWYDALGYGLLAWHPNASKPPSQKKSKLAEHKEKVAKRNQLRHRRMFRAV